MNTVKIQNVTKNYTLKSGLLEQFMGKSKVVSAVNNVSLNIEAQEIVGLVGESGCGKTTLGKMILKIEDITSGEIKIGDDNISNLKGKKLVSFRKEVQMIFQDPFDSLNPKMTVFEIILEPIKSLKLELNDKNTLEAIKTILHIVGLNPPETYLNRYPHRLSGGQRQRVAIARALIVNPKIIVADEPVSMLDASIRAGILTLLQNLNKDHGISILLITHDLATARFLCNRIVVMYLGEIIEIIPTDKLMKEATHPYTKLLLSSAPDLFSDTVKTLNIKGDAVNATAPPKGCRFWPRCDYAEEKCINENQILKKESDDKYVACWKFNKINK